MEIELLEYLAVKSGGTFISDIAKIPLDDEKKCALKMNIRRIIPESCTLREWNDAVKYITGADIKFMDRALAREHLLTYLSARERREKNGDG